jgi:HAD superfamily hydrolase (TIGR01549 family)
MSKIGCGVLLDLDQTLVLTQALEALRKKRIWPRVYAAFDRTLLPPGTSAFLSQAGALAKIGVVTSAPRPYATRLLAHHGLNIPVLVGYHDTPNRKPHPDPLLKAAGMLGVEPRNCIHVGDSMSDVEASFRAGMTTVLVNWEGRSDVSDTRVHLVARTWRELIEFIRLRSG